MINYLSYFNEKLSKITATLGLLEQQRQLFEDIVVEEIEATTDDDSIQMLQEVCGGSTSDRLSNRISEAASIRIESLRSHRVGSLDCERHISYCTHISVRRTPVGIISYRQRP